MFLLYNIRTVAFLKKTSTRRLVACFVVVLLFVGQPLLAQAAFGINPKDLLLSVWSGIKCLFVSCTPSPPTIKPLPASPASSISSIQLSLPVITRAANTNEGAFAVSTSDPAPVRVVERIAPSVSTVIPSGISPDELNARLEILTNKFTSDLSLLGNRVLGPSVLVPAPSEIGRAHV